ncbi:four-carbon acid sugar kinase family protein [Oceanicola sp. 502str15]|uniref:four-carbon acid sugar kinase family protein n=1 Tax=Oceanicola sp. 502str15 TaxID=2696061 RepID=UPI00209443A9|nr:four-carbon acid sugar kinase family protein [Oceanicola sp. 502str15]MCO6384737.1 four-carbon acid sugar kinase family protein [Oceanicola sp. 502str15]
MSLPGGILLGWLGDDFTGSAASMEVLEFAGVPSVLFLDVPSEDQLARFPGMRAVGVATTARSHAPAWMERELPRVFRFLADTGAKVVHYKTCSTLDSAPEVGSIGKAMDLGAQVVRGPFIPCLLAAPKMRRYQAFGHLFASGPGGVFRLDRHPVMARHPVTPMDESDVARHLARQTGKSFGLVTLEDLEASPEAEVWSFDAMTDAHMAQVGRRVWQAAPLLAVGSQGVEYALVEHWRESGWLGGEDRVESAGPVERMLAVSGSVSPVTAAQIAWAEAHGFEGIELDAAAAVRGEENGAYEAAIAALNAGRDPLIYTAKGPDDPAVARLRAAVPTGGMEEANARIGAALGKVLARLLRQTGLKRAVISGGDTSGHASRELGLFAFTALAPTLPGAALLAAHSDDENLAGLQLALKGGQMGSDDYFGWIKRGGGAV